MSDGNGAVHEEEEEDLDLDTRVRRLQRVVDERDAKTLSAIRGLYERLDADRETNRERHAELIRWLEGLSERIPKPARRSPKRGRR